MIGQTFLKNIFWNFAEMFQLIKEAVSSTKAFSAFMAEFGWTLDEAEIEQVRNIMKGIETNELDFSSQDINEVIESIKQSSSIIREVASSDAPAEFATTFPQELLDYLVYLMIGSKFPKTFAVLHFIGVIGEVQEPVNETIGRQAYIKRFINWESLPSFILEPIDTIYQTYGWNGAFKGDDLIRSLGILAAGFGGKASLFNTDEELVKQYFKQGSTYSIGLQNLVIPIPLPLGLENNPFANAKIALIALPIPPNPNEDLPPDGLVFLPLISGNVTQNMAISDQVTLSLGGDLVSRPIRLEIHPDQIQLIGNFEDTQIDATARLSASTLPSTPWYLIGDEKSSRLELHGLSFELGASGEVEDIETKIAFKLSSPNAHGKGVKALIQLDQADSFLQETTQNDNIEAWFDTEIIWSNKTGFTFGGSFGFDLDIQLNQKLGPIEITRLNFNIGEGPQLTSQKSIKLTTGLGFKGKLGPVQFIVEDVGFAMNFIPYSHEDLRNLPPDTDPPLLGLLDLDFGFSPPKGIALLIDSGSVKGGGYLLFDSEKAQYSGIVQLEISNKFELQAIGLLTTRLPNNQKGYSLLLLITAEGFTPIQVGFGFTLDKVGGLLGVHRSVATEALQAELKSGGLSSVLFPVDPLANADALIRDLRRFFPPAPDQFVFGPIGEFSWGKPVIMQLRLGIILEFPQSVRLHVLGQVRVGLPSIEKALVEFKMDMVGSLDFDKGEIAIDARLYDSRILWIDISGEMAMRIRWLYDPMFILSIGGFNPRFPVPAGFPKLDRLTFSLHKDEPTVHPTTGEVITESEGGSPSSTRLELQAYMALTSNTAQIGARFDLFVKAWEFSIEGFLYFHALLEFEPFRFMIEIGGGITLKAWGYTLLAMRLNMMLSGPQPWHVKGSVTIDLWLFDVTVSFDRQLKEGEPPPAPPAIDPMPMLVEALGDTRNWETQVAERGRSLISLREIFLEEDEVLVNPEVPIRVRQNVLPLNMKISRFGNARLAHEEIFSIQMFSNDDLPRETTNIDDYFAPAQFRDMEKGKKLSSPSFEKLNAGLSIGSTSLDFGQDDLPSLEMDYETWIMGTKEENATLEGIHILDGSSLEELTRLGTSDYRPLNRKKYHGPKVGIKKKPASFVLAHKDSLSAISDTVSEYHSFTEAEDALNEYTSHHPGRARKVKVIRKHLLVT